MRTSGPRGDTRAGFLLFEPQPEGVPDAPEIPGKTDVLECNDRILREQSALHHHPQGADALAITIADDGDGAVPRAARTAASQHSGLGLIGMRERVEAADGHLETGNLPECGFRVQARVPVSLR